MFFPTVRELVPALIAWRHDFHQFPEVGFSEARTAALVADRLRGFGLTSVVEGVGKTGVVGTLQKGSGSRQIALRADMDALTIHEQGQAAHRSQRDGLMHACGHDGHVSMLLGAANWLAQYGQFDGTVHFIFQPAEEWGKGALAMLADQLRERFPFDELYGLHNWPGLPVGCFATAMGDFMAAEDLFEITVRGVGGHASQPHTSNDVLVAASALVLALQTIVSRRVDPAQTAVVSVTEFITDGVRNVLPNQVRLKGDVRSFQPATSELIETAVRQIAAGIALSYACDVTVDYSREFIPLQNEAGATAAALQAAAAVFDPGMIKANFPAITVAEDFAQFVQLVPGNFALLGNGESSWPLHHPQYDFNDEVLPYGVQYFIELVQSRLA